MEKKEVGKKKNTQLFKGEFKTLFGLILKSQLRLEQRQRDAGQLVEDNAVGCILGDPPQALFVEPSRPLEIVDAEGDQADALLHLRFLFESMCVRADVSGEL